MTRKSLQTIGTGCLILGGAACCLSADGIAQLPAFQQPVALTGRIEAVEEAPAPAEPRRIFPKLRERFVSFPKQREVAVRPAAAQVEMPPQPQEDTLNPGHSLGPSRPDYFPAPPTSNEVPFDPGMPIAPQLPGNAFELPLEHSLNQMSPSPSPAIVVPAPVVACDTIQPEWVPPMPQQVQQVSPATTRISAREPFWKRLWVK